MAGNCSHSMIFCASTPDRVDLPIMPAHPITPGRLIMPDRRETARDHQLMVAAQEAATERLTALDFESPGEVSIRL